MIVSFTGTRHGMTVEQAFTVVQLLADLKPTECHHGDCVGADDQFANIAHEMKLALPSLKIIAHPGESVGGESLRASSPHNDIVLPVKHYFARNRDMVDLLQAGDVLIATPREATRQTGGGTWYTTSYGLNKNVHVLIVWPDGTVTETKPETR